MEAVNIDLSANSFQGISGTEYVIYPTLTMHRFEVLERLQVEIEHSVSITAFKRELFDCYELFNKMQFANGCTKLHNLLTGVERVANDLPHPILFICALFICTKEEDQSKWSEADAIEKIADWGHIDIAFFLSCAKGLVHRFTGDLSTVSQTSLE